MTFGPPPHILSSIKWRLGNFGWLLQVRVGAAIPVWEHATLGINNDICLSYTWIDEALPIGCLQVCYHRSIHPFYSWPATPHPPPSRNTLKAEIFCTTGSVGLLAITPQCSQKAMAAPASKTCETSHSYGVMMKLKIPLSRLAFWHVCPGRKGTEARPVLASAEVLNPKSILLTS